jgi:hypothetical protein
MIWRRWGQADQLPVGVAAHPRDPLAQADQPVEDSHRLGAGRDIAGEHDALGRDHVRFGQHRVQGRQHSVDVRQQRRRRDHAPQPAAPDRSKAIAHAQSERPVR